MRIESIELANFLSHERTRWEPNGTRLGAIVGPNGAGKSALLDGILYALYDAARARTDQLVRLGQTEMSASLEFSYNGARYRATRGRSTRGAGRTFLELAVRAPDGSWTPMTSDDIRSTQAAIDALLGLDADAFTTSVFLRQGESDRFITATAGDRKKLLGTLLGLDIYARAEQRAREEVRALELRTVSERDQVGRLESTIAELTAAEAVRDEAKAAIVATETAIAGDRERRVAITARLTELAAAIAVRDAAAAEVARLEEERSVLSDRYRRERASIATAEAALAAATATLAARGAVAEAMAALDTARADVVRLEAAEAADRALDADLTAARQAFADADAPLAAAVATWEAERAADRRRVDELVAGVNALAPVICSKCGTANVVDQAGLRDQLVKARARLEALETNEPKEPSTHRRARAALARLESRRRATRYDPEPLRMARERVAELERTAARTGEIAQAEAAATAAARAKADAEAELARIEATGRALAARIAEAKARAEEVGPLLGEQGALTEEAHLVDARIDVAERTIRGAEGTLATATAEIERRDQLVADVASMRAGLEATEIELGRLRRLVTAFGVTGIPARIIEGVLPELADYANELLAELRPGMTLELRAQRAKRDGKGVVEALDLIVRDDVGERPLGLFSGGERMSVSLAIAVGLSRLVARRAGSAIRSLVVDEPDGLDADARRAFGQALRVLAHHGDLERVVLVSHHPDLAEFADDVWSVSKGSSGSVVTQAA